MWLIVLLTFFFPRLDFTLTTCEFRYENIFGIALKNFLKDRKNIDNFILFLVNGDRGKKG